MEPWRIYRPLVADSYRYNFDEEQDPDTDQHLSKKLDPYLSDADPQP